MSEDRVTELEIKVAFQEDTITQLNDALVAQQGRVDVLERRVDALIETIARLQPAADPTAEEPPPHY